MIELSLIGIGSGAADHPTLQALTALRSAQLILLPRKGAEKAELAELRRALCARYVEDATRVVEFDMPARDAEAPDYLGAVTSWHAQIADIWKHMILRHLPAGGRMALMVWGDPALYDSSLRIAERLRSSGMDLRMQMIPGLSSLQLLTAAHLVPLNTLGGEVLITTGRRLRARGWPRDVDTVVVMLDGSCAFRELEPSGLWIYWGAYLGMPQQMLLSGALAQSAEPIVQQREQARAEHGWILDIYLLRRLDGQDKN